MRFSTLFTSQAPLRSSGRVAMMLGVLVLSGARAQDRTTEAGEAQIKDPNAECTPYYYSPVFSHLESFPRIWEPASILKNDTNAQSKWAAIQPTLPNIPPKGTPTGDFSNVSYPPTDPDCWWTNSRCTTPKLQGLSSDITNVPEPLTLGYGFDDGPNCSHNAFYDFLTSQNQKATMYYIGSNVMNWPLEAQRGVADGHEICVHTWSHRYMTGLGSEAAFAELYYNTKVPQMQAIKLVTGVTPTCWRPPFGDVDDRIRSIATRLGLRTILWKYDSFDWKVGTAGVTPADVDNNYQNFITSAKNGTFNTAGGIILMHEINNYTMSEAIKQYPMMKAAFKWIVPVGVAYNITQPYVEQNYTQLTFEQYTSGQTANGGTSPITGTTTKPPSANQANDVAAVFIPIGTALFAAFIGATFMS